MAASGSRRKAIPNEHGSIVEPRGAHRATIVWLHDLNQECSNSLHFVKSLNLGNIKWICLSTFTSYFTCTHGVGLCTTAWATMGSPEHMENDLRVLDSVAKRVANILSTEPGYVIKGVGGVGIGGQVALYFASRCALGHYQIPLQVVIGINGWLYTWDSIKSRIKSTDGAATRAASQSIILTAGTSDPRIPVFFVEQTVDSLREAGFGEVSFVPFPMFGHDFNVNAMLEVKAWLKQKLPLDPNEDLP